MGVYNDNTKITNNKNSILVSYNPSSPNQIDYFLKMSTLKGSQHLKIQLTEIEAATKNFGTCIGKGGYGLVYKGELFISGKLTTVAIKRLSQYFGQGSKEFLTEIQLLSGQKHPNLVSLLGFCDEGKEKIIVYEYAERESLDKYLRRSANTYTLTWLERLKICVDAARGLEHLHSHVGEHLTIIHRDVKSANILIDENWVSKVSDLGLSKLSLAGFGRSAVITHACGTPGYCEPEYIITGIVKKESDVYSFGMVLFEVLCGRLCNLRDDDGFLLSAPLVKKYYEMNKVDEIVDPSLLEHMSSSSMSKFSEIANRCLHDIREERPPMSLVREDIQELLDIQVESEFGKEFGSWPYEELFAIRYMDIHYDKSNMFPWINNYGRKCLLLSAKRCVVSKQEKYLTWVFQPDLFAMVSEFASWKFIHIHCEINPMMLSLGSIYTASLVFKFTEKPNADLKLYKLITIKWKKEELSVCSTHTAELTSDKWYAIKMWNFIHHKLIKDFHFVIEEFSCPEDPYMPRHGLMVQGIQFQPADLIKHEGNEALNITSISNEDAHWDKNLRRVFQQYLKVPDSAVSYITVKEFHFHCSAGFLGYNRELWFSLCQSTGGICSMMPLVNSLRENFLEDPTTMGFSESRFGKVKKIESKRWHMFTCRLWAPIFSPNNLYAIYLVFKFADNHVLLDNIRLWTIWYWLDDIDQGAVIAHLNFPPPMNIPTIKSDNENGSPESSNIPKPEEVRIPKGSKEFEEQNWMEQRTDGWMEVMLCKKLHRLEHHYTLKVEMYSKIGPFHEIIVEGIEFRPVRKCI